VNPAWQALVISLSVVVLVQMVLVLALYRQFGLVYLGRAEARSRDGLALRTVAPKWQAADQFGQTHSSSDYLGRAQVIIFAEPGCEPCKKLLPELRVFADENDDVGVILVGSSDLVLNRAMAEAHGVDLPILTQKEDDLSGMFKVTATPFLFVVDQEGVIREKGIVNVKGQIEEKLLAVRWEPQRTEVAA